MEHIPVDTRGRPTAGRRARPILSFPGTTVAAWGPDGRVGLMREGVISLKRWLLSLIVIAMLILGTAAAAMASQHGPPGNGNSHNGNCTGNPNSHPGNSCS